MQYETKNILIKKRRISQEALEKLAIVSARFSQQRRDGRRIIMLNCVLAGLNFRNLCFAQAHFLACDFAGADLTDSDFSRAKLFASRFEGANLTRANFERADLRAVVFDKALLDETRFDHADLRKGSIITGDDDDLAVSRELLSSFRDANLSRTNLSHAHLKDVDFSGANLDATNLEGADLRGSRFVGAEFKGVRLTNASLHESDLRGASFEDMDLSHTGIIAAPAKPIDDDTLHAILDAHELWVGSGGRTGTRADFTAYNLAGRSLSQRNLAAISFANSNLKEVDFRGAVLAACDFSNANLRLANMSHCDLRGSNLEGALLEEARFDRADVGTLPETGMTTRFPEGFKLCA